MRRWRHWSAGLALAPAVLAGPLVADVVTHARAVAAVSAAPVSVFPEPGSSVVSPETTISFRGAAPASLGTITVTGDRSGRHDGAWLPHSDGRGASFRPASPFTPGEHVTVATQLDVRGTTGGTFGYRVAQPEAGGSSLDGDEYAPVAASGSRALAAAAAAPPPALYTYATAPGLHPPIFRVTGNPAAANNSLIALTPRGVGQVGPLLIDNRGQTVWYDQLSLNDFTNATDAKVVRYQGRDVLAWWQGRTNEIGHGDGVYKLVDNHYQVVATIDAGNGYTADLHDMLVTPQNTAITMSYVTIAMDLTPYGGPADGKIEELVVQEIDIPTGAVLFEWHSLDHISPSKSQLAPPASAPWDYIHGNGLELGSDGTLLVSARHTSAIYKINRTTGALIWTLGKGGDFTPSFPSSDWFAYQHDPRWRTDGTLSVFDNGSGLAPAARSYTRGLVLSVDEVHHTVKKVREVRGKPDVSAFSQGSFRPGTDGHELMGWGQVGELTEFDAAGNQVLDMKYPDGYQSYRAVRVDWHAQPLTPPSLVFTRNGYNIQALVSWNGATDVATWVLKAGPDASHLSTLTSVPRSGFETAIRTTTRLATFVVEARDAHGAVLGRTATVTPQGVPGRNGYLITNVNGAVGAFGAAVPRGNAAVGFSRAVGIASSSTGGYWVAKADGSVSAIGAPALGSLAGIRHAPVVGIAATPDGNGYWLVAADGGVFTFGTARFYGSTGAIRLHQPMIGMAPAPDGKGYWLVAADGGVFNFGSAQFRGSTGAIRLNAPVVGIAAGGDDNGYWLAAADGGVFNFGSAPFRGSMGGKKMNTSVGSVASTIDGKGYWLVGVDGGVFTFGNAPFSGAFLGSGAAASGITHT